MFDAIKKTMLDNAKEAVRSYNEGRHEMDAETRRAFDRLDLPYESDFESIKKRYRELSKAYHPDMGNSKNTDEFLAIKKAYDVLKSAYQNGADNG